MKEKKLTVTFVNVGYGEAILLECPDPSRPGGVFTALIDGGSAEESEFADRASGRLPVEEYLKMQGRFAHMFKPGNEWMIEEVQKEVDKNWEELLKLCEL